MLIFVVLPVVNFTNILVVFCLKLSPYPLCQEHRDGRQEEGQAGQDHDDSQLP
jgi:hypothetical protein